MSSVYIPRTPWYAKGVLFILLLTTKMLRYIHTFINYYSYVNILRLVGYIARIYLKVSNIPQIIYTVLIYNFY